MLVSGSGPELTQKPSHPPLLCLQVLVGTGTTQARPPWSDLFLAQNRSMKPEHLASHAACKRRRDAYTRSLA